MENKFHIDYANKISKVYAIQDDRIFTITDYNYTSFNQLQEHTWTYRPTYNGNGYFVSSKDGISLHQFVMDLNGGKEERLSRYKAGEVIDHINNNGRDNRILNLQYLPKAENSAKVALDRKIKAINKEGWYYITVMRLPDTNIYCLSIRDNIIGHYQNYHRMCYSDIKKDLDTFIPLINAYAPIALDDGTVTIQDDKCYSVHRDATIGRMFKDGVLEQYEGIRI